MPDPSEFPLRDALRHAVTELLRWVECVGEDENATRETCGCGGCIAWRKGQAALAAVREVIKAGTRVPGEVPFCAGRSAVAHTPTAMVAIDDGWKCPECGEPDRVDFDANAPDDSCRIGAE